MNGYDWDFGFGFGRRYLAHRSRAGQGYGGEFQVGPDRFYGRGRRGGFAGGGGEQRRRAGGVGGGYDRGVYGGDHPTFGGHPGGQRQGMYYGGQQYGNQQYGDQQQWGGAGRGGYDSGFARQPFLPDATYRRHPELDRPPQRGGDRWASQGHGPFYRAQRSDAEIAHSVRENLYEDSWVEADDIEVTVQDGVVTLRGEVTDYLEARYAWDDAWEAQGVRGVINQITVRTDLPADEHSTPPQTSG